jgi:hypothetical protein
MRKSPKRKEKNYSKSPICRKTKSTTTSSSPTPKPKSTKSAQLRKYA